MRSGYFGTSPARMDSVLDGGMEMVFLHIHTRTTRVSPSTRHTVTTSVESDAQKSAYKFLVELQRPSTGTTNQTGASKLCTISMHVSAIVERLDLLRRLQRTRNVARTTKHLLE